MENYVFVCIGTNRLIEDSFGPRVGDILKRNFYKSSNIKVLGTMESPVHFQNAPIFVDYLKQEKSQLILIDSALGEKERIGSTYINSGGLEIGKAFGKSFYFPAHLNIKTIVGAKQENEEFSIYNKQKCLYFQNKKSFIDKLAQGLASQITRCVYEII